MSLLRVFIINWWWILSSGFSASIEMIMWFNPSFVNVVYHVDLWVLKHIWDAVSRASVLILPPIKFNSQLSGCTFFQVNTVMFENPIHFEGNTDWQPWTQTSIYTCSFSTHNNTTRQLHVKAKNLLFYFLFFYFFKWFLFFLELLSWCSGNKSD